MSHVFRFTGAEVRLARSAPRSVGVALALLAAASMANAEDPAAPAALRPAATAGSFVGLGFDTPEAAARALCHAYEANDDAALKALVGPGNDDLVQNGRESAVRVRRTALAAAAKESLALERLADGRVLVVVGTTQYPLPLPLVSRDGRWGIDAASGRREVLARRIGENEMDALCMCLAYADCQVQYASEDRNGDGVKEYAQLLVSTPGGRDGLHWDSDAAQDPSPAGPGLTPLLPTADAERLPRAPHGGYYWRILTAQGPDAPGGAYSYVINGRMIAGFALLAVPAQHRESGVMSFLVSNQGQVYEKDLGPDTLKVARGIAVFDPDTSWRKVEPGTLQEAVAALTAEEDSLGEVTTQAPDPTSAPGPCPKQP